MRNAYTFMINFKYIWLPPTAQTQKLNRTQSNWGLKLNLCFLINVSFNSCGIRWNTY